MTKSESRQHYAQSKDELAWIVKLFADEKSRKLYENLVQLNVTHNLKFLEQALSECGIAPDPAITCCIRFKQLKESGKTLIYYGLGQITAMHFALAEQRRDTPGYLFFPFVSDIEWDGFSDKQYARFNGKYQGKPIFAPNAIPKDAVIAVSVVSAFEEIKRELLSIGFHSEQILPYYLGNTKVFEDKQYFGEDFFAPRKETAFVDAGSYTGDTIERFIKWNAQMGYERVLGFEPDPANFEACSWKAPELGHNIRVLNAGASDCKKAVLFSSNGDGSSFFNEKGDIMITLTTIDDALGGGGGCSLIKLDVEGFELAALKGAQTTIKTCHPRIACCLYHKYEDLIDIPRYIAELSSAYRFYLRMYANEYLEIVLYAV